MKTGETPRLYTTKQAATICFSGGVLALNKAIERGHVEYTSVDQGGDRKQRGFTQEQLLWAAAYSNLTSHGAKPENAAAFIKQARHGMRKGIPFLSVRGRQQPAEAKLAHIVFHDLKSTPLYIATGDNDALAEAVRGGGCVLDYSLTVEHINREVQNIEALTRYIEMHPEKFEG